jgi:maleylpyruvate isomerase
MTAPSQGGASPHDQATSHGTGDLAAGPRATWRSTFEELHRSTERLVATVERLTDDAAREPCRLPGWTRGHVVTHLARNADGLHNLVVWAATGEERPMYASQEARDADIEAGSGRPAGELLSDLVASARRLDDALLTMPPEGMGRVVRMRASEVPGAEIPLLRIREVEIHHVDLDYGYTPAHWTPEFAERTLDQISPQFADRDMPVSRLRGTTSGRVWHVGGNGPELSGPESALVAWLTGRSDGDGLLVDGADPGVAVPRAPRWV